jgi:hypothetical protein
MRVPSFAPGAADPGAHCPACGSARLRPFFETRGAPATTTILIPSRAEARAVPRGDILLCLCEACGFVHNARFDARLTEYSERYEGTQSYSPTFDAYHRGLALDLIERHGLRGRRVLEIGCGQGEFLELLCELGANEGIGFDPAVRKEGEIRVGGGRVRYVKQFYSPALGDEAADLTCCKMTLEHVPDVGAFAAMLREAVGDRPGAVLYVQVPEFGLILREAHFHDVMYEHCSYYTAESLRGIFERAGFDVLATPITYAGQHLGLEARPGRSRPGAEPGAALRELCAGFAARCEKRARRWADDLGDALARGKRVVVWGSGSKAASFLEALGLGDEVAAVVDINPNRHGMYLAGGGHEIVAPESLPSLDPDLVVAVNPIYRDEIAAQLARLDLRAELRTLAP